MINIITLKKVFSFQTYLFDKIQKNKGGVNTPMIKVPNQILVSSLREQYKYCY